MKRFKSPGQAQRFLSAHDGINLQFIAEHGRMASQKVSGYTTRARAEAAIRRFKRVIGDGLRSRTDQRRATKVRVAVHALNCMLEIRRPISLRIA